MVRRERDRARRKRRDAHVHRDDLRLVGAEAVVIDSVIGPPVGVDGEILGDDESADRHRVHAGVVCARAVTDRWAAHRHDQPRKRHAGEIRNRSASFENARPTVGALGRGRAARRGRACTSVPGLR